MQKNGLKANADKNKVMALGEEEELVCEVYQIQREQNIVREWQVGRKLRMRLDPFSVL